MLNFKKHYIKYFHNYSSSGFSFDSAILNEFGNLENAETLKILDFGCGKKPFAQIFSQAKEYKGLDVYEGEKVDIVYDGKIIPFDDNYFDVIFSSSVLEHVEDLDFTLKEINRILRRGGVFISVVPFINHLHGTPIDFTRLTYYGWFSKLSNKFPNSEILIKPVDNKLVCILNLITSAINNIFYDFLKLIRKVVFSKKLKDINSIKLSDGGASPESAEKAVMISYFLAKINPINFVLGLIALVASNAGISNNKEGQITSGYIFTVKKE